MRGERATLVLRVVVLAALLLLPALSLVGGTIMFAPILAIPALFVITGLLFDGSWPEPGPGHGPDDGGERPPPPVIPPLPAGDIPLTDAAQSRVRARNHPLANRAWSRPRRSAPPERRRTRDPAQT